MINGLDLGLAFIGIGNAELVRDGHLSIRRTAQSLGIQLRQVKLDLAPGVKLGRRFCLCARDAQQQTPEQQVPSYSSLIHTMDGEPEPRLRRPREPGLATALVPAALEEAPE